MLAAPPPPPTPFMYPSHHHQHPQHASASEPYLPQHRGTPKSSTSSDAQHYSSHHQHQHRQQEQQYTYHQPPVAADSWGYGRSPSVHPSSSLPVDYPSAPSTSTSTAAQPASSTALGPMAAMGRKRKRLQKACVSCHKAKRRCDGGLPCSNCDFSGRACAYADAAGNTVPPPRREAPPSAAAAAAAAAAVGPSSYPVSPPPQHHHDAGRDSFEGRHRTWSSASRSNGQRSPGAQRSSLGLNDDVADLRPDQRRGLLHVFFAALRPFSSIIDETCFLRDLASSDVPPGLLFAIYALSTSKNPQRIPGDERSRVAQAEYFSISARKTLFEEGERMPHADEPSLEAAQTFVILAMYEAGMGRHRRAHMLAANAVRQIVYLRLHQGQAAERHSSTSAYGRDSSSDAAIRKHCTFRFVCVAFTLDILLAALAVTTPSVQKLDVDIALSALDEASGGDEHTLAFVQLLKAFSIFTAASAVPRALQHGIDSSTPPSEIRSELGRWSNRLERSFRFDDANLATATRALQEHSTASTAAKGSAWCWVMMHAVAESSTFVLCANEPTSSPTERQQMAAVGNLELILDAMGPSNRACIYATLPILVANHAPLRPPASVSLWLTDVAAPAWSLSDGTIDGVMKHLGVRRNSSSSSMRSLHVLRTMAPPSPKAEYGDDRRSNGKSPLLPTALPGMARAGPHPSSSGTPLPRLRLTPPPQLASPPRSSNYASLQQGYSAYEAGASAAAGMAAKRPRLSDNDVGAASDAGRPASHRESSSSSTSWSGPLPALASLSSSRG